MLAFALLRLQEQMFDFIKDLLVSAKKFREELNYNMQLRGFYRTAACVDEEVPDEQNSQRRKIR